MDGVKISEIPYINELKEKIGLAHDCCLYARSYFETRQKDNNPDNELGKTLKAIKLLDEVWNEIDQGQVRLSLSREILARNIHEYWRGKILETGSIRCNWEELHDAGREGYLEQADFIIEKQKDLFVVVREK